MNLVRCRVADDGALLSAASFALPSPPAARAALAARASKTVIVGMRPENIVEASRPAREPTAALELSAELVEPLGNEVVLHGRHGDDLIVFKMDPHQQPAMGDRVKALVELDALHLFDADSEKRISY